MQEKELITKIKSLKNIKPNKNWVLSAREGVFRENDNTFSFPVFSRFSFAVPATLLLLVGVFVFSQYMTVMNMEKNKEAERIVKEREIEKLVLALDELKSAKETLSQDFAQSIESKPKEETIKVARDFAPKLLEMEEEEDLLTSSLGVLMEEKDEGKIASSVARDLSLILIEDLEERSLSEKDEEILNQAKERFNEEDYRSALRSALDVGQDRKDDEEENDNIEDN